MRGIRLSWKNVAPMLLAASIVLLPNAHAQIPSFGGGRDLTDMIPKFAGKTEKQTGASGGQKVAGAGLGCALGGGLGLAAGDELARLVGKEQNASSAEVQEMREAARLAGAAYGCLLGGAAGVAAVENLSQGAQQAREEAFQEAMQATGPSASVTWSDPGDPETHGLLELDFEPLTDGKQCAMRREVIAVSEGRAEPEPERWCWGNGEPPHPEPLET